ncbi:hypothetical protein D1818_24315 [Aquimarina sp. BL5]|nr:hypothetical protein D1818_24315 [Aquimarina sp. BL5]
MSIVEKYSLSPYSFQLKKTLRVFPEINLKTRVKSSFFCSVIEDIKGGRILIEVFDRVETLDEILFDILKSNQLFSSI